MRQENYEMMSIEDIMKYSDEQNREGSDSAGKPDEIDCPGEAEVLAYCEGWIAENRGAELDRHFAECEKCIELLAVFALISNDHLAGKTNTTATRSEEAREQAEKIALLIDRDEENFS